MILIVGSEGAQGKRYQSILKYLGHRFCCLDKTVSPPPNTVLKEITGIIIATPTDTHLNLVRFYMSLKKPFLVEKPLSKDIDALSCLLKDGLSTNLKLSMVAQYRHLLTQFTIGNSHYDYFRHGNDGLAWDCLQIVGFARGKVELKEESPIWDCTINGEVLNIRDMDRAYVIEVEQWLHNKNQMEPGFVLEMHQKVREYQECGRL